MSVLNVVASVPLAVGDRRKVTNRKFGRRSPPEIKTIGIVAWILGSGTLK